MKVLVAGDFHGELPKLFDMVSYYDLDLLILIEDICKILPEHRRLKYKAKSEGWEYFKKIKPGTELSFIKEEMKTGRKILEKIDGIGIPTLIIPGNVDGYDYAFREEDLLKGLKNIINIQLIPYRFKG